MDDFKGYSEVKKVYYAALFIFLLPPARHASKICVVMYFPFMVIFF